MKLQFDESPDYDGLRTALKLCLAQMANEEGPKSCPNFEWIANQAKFAA